MFICFFRFEIPTLFPCQHTLCVACVRRIAKDNEKSLLCPVCRGDATNGQLIPNFTLQELLDITARHTCLGRDEPASSGGDGQQVRLPSFYLLLLLRCIYVMSFNVLYEGNGDISLPGPCSMLLLYWHIHRLLLDHLPHHIHSSLLDGQSYQERLTSAQTPTETR